MLAAELIDCGNNSLLEFLSAIERLGDVVGEIQGDDEDHVTITPTGTANEFTFVANYDLSGNGFLQSTLNGRIAFSADPTALSNGDTAVLTFSQASSEAPTITANLSVTFFDGADDIGLAGTVLMIDGIECNTTFTIRALSPLRFGSGAAALAGATGPELVLFDVAGVFDVLIESDSMIEATVTLNRSGTIRYTDVLLNGGSFDDQSVFLPPEGDFAAMTDCVIAGIDSVARVVTNLEALTEAVRTNQAFVNGEPFSFVAVPGLTDTFDYTLDDEGTSLAGRIAYPADPNGDPITGVVELSWTSAAVGLAGNPLPDGRSAGPFLLNLSGGLVQSYAGTSTVTNPVPNCAVSVSISATDPVAVDGSAGSVRLVATSRSNSFRVTVRFDGSDTTLADVVVNDRLLPPALLDGIVDLLLD